MPHVMVQITKKLAMAVPDVLPPFLASLATMLPQYMSPASTVTAADIRNHHNARSMRLGITFPFVTGSSSFIERGDGLPEGLFGSGFVALGERGTHIAQSRAQARGVAAVPGSTAFGLTGALKGRKMICHLRYLF